MSNRQKFINSNRRSFLKSSAVVTATAAGGAASIASATESVELKTEELSQPQSHAGYQETDRVRQYYLKARF